MGHAGSPAFEGFRAATSAAALAMSRILVLPIANAIVRSNALTVLKAAIALAVSHADFALKIVRGGADLIQTKTLLNQLNVRKLARYPAAESCAISVAGST